MAQSEYEGTTPQYAHDCDHDIFLGRFTVPWGPYAGAWDLYYADHGGLPDTLLARWGDEPPHYNSGLFFGAKARAERNNPMGEAFRRAVRALLISEDRHE